MIVLFHLKEKFKKAKNRSQNAQRIPKIKRENMKNTTYISINIKKSHPELLTPQKTPNEDLNFEVFSYF